jgi:glycine betaine/proline transport system substrate-binding protein
MNTKIDLTYLSGGDAYFGPSYGSTTVNTLSQSGYGADCPNAARLFSQLAFTVEMENQIMSVIIDDRQSLEDAASAYLKAHPDLIDLWVGE